MIVKIFSVRTDDNFRATRVGDKSRRILANEFLENEMQKVLDDNLRAQIKHVQFRSQIITKSESERFNPSSASLGYLVVNLKHEVRCLTTASSRTGNCAAPALPAGYAARSAKVREEATIFPCWGGHGTL